MEPIHQTPFGRLLCWLGVHQLTWGQRNYEDGSFSLTGGCIRCNHGFGWDA